MHSKSMKTHPSIIIFPFHKYHFSHFCENHTKNFVQLCCISFGVSFSFSLIQFCGLIFFITHLGWTHELLNIWTAAPSCRSALLKTCKHAFVWTTDTTHYSCYTANENFQEEEVLSQQNHHANSYKADMISCKDSDCRYLRALAISWDMRACFSRSSSSHVEPTLIDQTNERGVFPWASLLRWLRWTPDPLRSDAMPI